MTTVHPVYTGKFVSWRESLWPLLEKAGLAEAIGGRPRLLIKPNLVEAQPPPVTTPVELVAALIDYCRASAPGVEIIVGEGAGAAAAETREVFEALGYAEMAARQQVALLDLNHAPLVELVRPECRRWPRMHLPQVVFDTFLISVPVLKAHSLAGVTLTMKNMMGLAPPSHYQQGGNWKKAAFHAGIQEAVLDLNRYRTPDFTVLDATVGMQEAHLWGPTCEPPPERVAASRDPVAVDAYGCELLGVNWRTIGHLCQAHGELGLAEPLDLREIG